MSESRTIGLLHVLLLAALGLALVVLGVLRLLVLPRFLLTFRDLGGPLPASTLFVATPWGVAAVAAASVALGGLGLALRRSAPIVLGILVAGAGIATCLWGSYAPIFDLAGAIQAE